MTAGGFTTSMETKSPLNQGLGRTGIGFRPKGSISPPPIVEIESIDDPYLFPISTKSNHPLIYVDGDSPTDPKKLVFNSEAKQSLTTETSPDVRMAKRASISNMGARRITESKMSPTDNFFSSDIATADLKAKKGTIFQNMNGPFGNMSHRHPGQKSFAGDPRASHAGPGINYYQSTSNIDSPKILEHDFVSPQGKLKSDSVHRYHE